MKQLTKEVFAKKGNFSKSHELSIDWKKSFAVQPGAFMEEQCIFSNYVTTKDFYFIHDKKREKDIGFFIVIGKTISCFYVKQDLQKYYDNQEIFDTIIEAFGLEIATLNTIDVFFMNHALVKAKNVKVLGCTGLEIYVDKVIEREKDKEYDLIKAKKSDRKIIWDMAQHEPLFMIEKELDEMLKNENLYLLFKKDQRDELIGIGVFVKHIFFDGGAIGMCINRKYRRKGLGTYLLQSLQNVAVKEGIHRISSGCALENVGSRKTLQKSGATLKGRFVVIEFVEKVTSDNVIRELKSEKLKKEKS